MPESEKNSILLMLSGGRDSFLSACRLIEQGRRVHMITYDNKCILVTAITEYLQYLEGQGVLSAGESYAEIDIEAQERWLKSQGVETADLTEQQLKEYQTGSWVFIKCGGRLVDALEDFQVVFHAEATLAA